MKPNGIVCQVVVSPPWNNPNNITIKYAKKNKREMSDKLINGLMATYDKFNRITSKICPFTPLKN